MSPKYGFSSPAQKSCVGSVACGITATYSAVDVTSRALMLLRFLWRSLDALNRLLICELAWELAAMTGQAMQSLRLDIMSGEEDEEGPTNLPKHLPSWKLTHTCFLAGVPRVRPNQASLSDARHPSPCCRRRWSHVGPAHKQNSFLCFAGLHPCFQPERLV